MVVGGDSRVPDMVAAYCTGLPRRDLGQCRQPVVARVVSLDLNSVIFMTTLRSNAESCSLPRMISIF